MEKHLNSLYYLGKKPKNRETLSETLYDKYLPVRGKPKDSQNILYVYGHYKLTVQTDSTLKDWNRYLSRIGGSTMGLKCIFFFSTKKKKIQNI